MYRANPRCCVPEVCICANGAVLYSLFLHFVWKGLTFPSQAGFTSGILKITELGGMAVTLLGVSWGMIAFLLTRDTVAISKCDEVNEGMEKKIDTSVADHCF